MTDPVGRASPMAVAAAAAAEAVAAEAVAAEAVTELPPTQVILRFFIRAEHMTTGLPL